MTTSNEEQLLLSIDEACARLRISRPTIYGLFNSGQIATIHIGRARRVPVSALESFIAAKLSGNLDPDAA